MKVEILTKEEIKKLVREQVRAEMSGLLLQLEKVRNEKLSKVAGERADDELRLEEMPFQPRCKGVFDQLQIETVGELCKLSHANLRKFRNIGRQTVENIEIVLRAFGRELGD